MATGKPSSDPDRRNKQSKANRGRLTAGMFYEGTIQACNYAAMTYTVALANGDTAEGVRDGTGLFCGLIGIKTTQRLSPGTLVLLAKDSTPWIIATAPADTPDLQAYLSRTITGKGLKSAIKTSHPNSKAAAPEHNMPEDLYEGEFEMANLMGGFLRFLTFMTSLGVNERASIEFHLTRDLTRLLSHNFEHFACDGDRKIYDDGRLNAETNTTTYDHERLGALDPSSEKSPVTESKMPEDFDPLTTGRWRYTELKGFIGDFINRWITDPTEVLGRMAEEAVRSGKSRVHMGMDGTILLQSVGEIALERVCRIQVPIRLKHEEDPEGVIREHMDELDKNFLKIWNQDGGKSEHHTLFKIREYVRYLNQYQSLARIHQLAAKGQEWKVPTEDDTPIPQPNGREKDREAVNQGDTLYYKDAYSTIRIMRDGSILTFDSYGNNRCSGPYGIIDASARHHYTYAAGDIVRKAGGSIFDSARRHIEIVASRGGLVLKGRTFLRGLCERGTLWLKSDYDPLNPYVPEGIEDPENPGKLIEQDPAAEVVGDQGIRIQATQSETRWLSWRRARFLVQKPPVDDEDEGEALEFGSLANIKFSSSKDTGFSVGGGLKLTVKKLSHWVFEDVLMKAKTLLLPGSMQLKMGEVTIPVLKAKTIDADSRISGPRNTGKTVNKDDRTPWHAHTNHIEIYDGEKIELPFDYPDSVNYQFNETGSAAWSLLVPSEYQAPSAPKGAKADADLLFEPLTQQQLRLDEPEGYAVWTGASDALLPGFQTATSSRCWPGVNRKWLRQNSPAGPSLSSPTSREASSFSPDIQTALTPGAIAFSFLAR